MDADFRLSADFVDHPKTRKLIRALGLEALRALLKLWSYAARNRPSGALTGMSEEDVELAADWPDTRAGEFAKALIDVRFLDRNGDALSLHNWATRQPFLADREARSEQARRAARARWNGHAAPTADVTSTPIVCAEHAASMHGACDQHADRNARSDPDPSDPDPSGNGNSGSTGDREENMHPAAGAADGAPPKKIAKNGKAQRVFRLWCETVKRLPKPQRLSERWVAHAAARFDQYGLDRLRAIFERLDRSTFAVSGNWADFEFCVKSDANCEKILAGKYDDRGSDVATSRNDGGRKSATERSKDSLARVLAEENGHGRDSQTLVLEAR